MEQVGVESLKDLGIEVCLSTFFEGDFPFLERIG
jgi:hypothetical protein